MSNLINSRELVQQQESGPSLRIIDVRSPAEYAAGHIPEAENIPAEEIERSIAQIPKDKPIVVY